MTTHETLSAEESADRLAIQRLVDAWAHCADRRQARQQGELFTPQGTVAVYMGDPATHAAIQTIVGQEDLTESFAVLTNYEHTTHFNGQSTITVNDDSATGETYCLAHHVWTENEVRQLMVMSIRYIDTFARTDDGWRFDTRNLIIDWTSQQPLTTQ
jgi:hypothetical protein